MMNFVNTVFFGIAGASMRLVRTRSLVMAMLLKPQSSRGTQSLDLCS